MVGLGGRVCGNRFAGCVVVLRFSFGVTLHGAFFLLLAARNLFEAGAAFLKPVAVNPSVVGAAFLLFVAENLFEVGT